MPLEPKYHCPLCDTNLVNTLNWQRHVACEKHCLLKRQRISQLEDNKLLVIQRMNKDKATLVEIDFMLRKVNEII
jgi:hypothetical protein